MNKINIILLVLAVALAGCRGSKPVIPKYYVVEYPHEQSVSLIDTIITLPNSVEIAQVEVYPAFATHRIAVRENTHELRYFSNSEWAVRPEQSITNYINEFLQVNRFFEVVSTRYWNELPDYRLETTVYQMEILQDRNTFLAHLHLKFSLTNIESERVIVTHTADRTRELERRNLNLFADAINHMLFEELQRFFVKASPILKAQ